MRRTLTFALSLLLCASAFAASDPSYVALRGARPDGRTIALSNFVFERDVFRFTLNGKLHLLAAVEGKTAGAVFIGQGSYELKPATPQEQRQLALHTGDDALTMLADQFDSAIFLGGALIVAAEKSGPATTAGADPDANDRWDDYLKKQRKDLSTNMHIRLLQEILNGESEPFFFAWIKGKKHPQAAIFIDPRDVEQTAMYVLHNDKGGQWYSNRYKSEIDRGQSPLRQPLADPEHYLIDATIKGSELSATTTMTFKPTVNLRVLPINLFSKLRISAAEWAAAGDAPTWSMLPFIQEEYKEDGDAAVVFPSMLTAGQKYLLRVTYGGKDVLENAGDGNFYIGARTSWYPNVAIFDDLAHYELHFRCPQKLQIIGVGSESSNTVEGDQRVSVWKTTNPIRVAGFNYGKFKKLAQDDKDSGMTVEVYTNPGTPDIIRDINNFLEAQSMNSESGMMGNYVKVDTARLAQSAIADGINTARTGNAYFGPLGDKRVAITQQSQWNFGQSWPTLIYMPYIAFLNGTQRNTLGLNDARDFVDQVGAHEFAHQWWGHHVGWKTYRDVWLSEGFSEFTSALVLQQTSGWPAYDTFFEKARRNILEKPAGAVISNNEAGPISQGARIGSWQNRFAYGPIIYSKGAYVLHMIRMAMHDGQKGDEAFMAMMREFAATYAGKNPSTADFKRIVEKHAPPVMKLTSDGKLDWFFNQWVHGTTIPKFESKFDFKDLGGGKYKVTGTLTQSGVTDNFASVLPIYVHFDKKSFSKLGATAIVGNSTKPVEFEIALPKKPQKFSVNAMHDVLAR